ncbi:MAG: MaoC family dehydratase [Saprospiraceae bacterium]|nr:MaoC family dehydratase [Saprospiraceae bacterium]
MLFDNLDSLKQYQGKTLPSSDWLTVDQHMIQTFADATHDQQWIHTDPEKAAQFSPFGKTLAHGFLSLSLMPHLIEQVLQIKSVQMGLNYGLNKVRFPQPVLVDSRVRLKASLAKYEEMPQGLKIFLNCTIEIEGSEKPACVAEWINLLFE